MIPISFLSKNITILLILKWELTDLDDDAENQAIFETVPAGSPEEFSHSNS